MIKNDKDFDLNKVLDGLGDDNLASLFVVLLGCMLSVKFMSDYKKSKNKEIGDSSNGIKA